MIIYERISDRHKKETKLKQDKKVVKLKMVAKK